MLVGADKLRKKIAGLESNVYQYILIRLVYLQKNHIGQLFSDGQRTEVRYSKPLYLKIHLLDWGFSRQYHWSSTIHAWL